MPRVSTFFGIVIWMYHDESHHGGRPHFHAQYGEDEATIDMESFEILAGSLSPRARRLVIEWTRTNPSSVRTGSGPAPTSLSFLSSRCDERSTICGDAQHANPH